MKRENQLRELMYKDGTLKKILLEKTKLKTKVIEQNRSSEKEDFKSKDQRYNLSESLILAQDERWRRA